MDAQENEIARHYRVEGLVSKIVDGLRAMGIDPDAVKASDIKGVDEFHTGGVASTDALLGQCNIDASQRVLDIGCGIGGAARHIAGNTGAHVTGVDLTPSYVDVATQMSDMVGLSDRTVFQEGSALDLPVNSSEFDVATMFHVGMNIADKHTLFSEAARVLKPSGTFAVFDIVKAGDADLNFPVPWAAKAEQSFVGSEADYLAGATAAGMVQVATRDRTDFAIEFFDKVFAAMKKNGGPPPIGLHLLIGPETPLRLKNMSEMFKDGLLKPMEMIFRAGG